MEAGAPSGLEKSQVAVDEKEEDSGEDHAEIGDSNMEHVEENIDGVEMVCVVEDFEHFPPHAVEARRPNGQ